ncbi:MAG: gluconate permease, partial [Eggerthellaceae bacterium]|nr:gluconate permease [Eggerthellaceae bacterium]
FLMAAPLVLSIAHKARISPMKLIIPVVVGCTMGHSLFPPQPGPIALVAALDANVPMVYVYGVIVIIPALLCAGILLHKLVPSILKMKLKPALSVAECDIPLGERPGFGLSISIPLLPAVLIIGCSIMHGFFQKEDLAYQIFAFIGSANISMFITFFYTAIQLMIRRGSSWADVSKKMVEGIQGVVNVLIVICAGGVVKQVIIDSGIANQIVELVSNVPISPYVIAWLITAIIRILTGQGAVAAITSAGMIAPLVAQFGLDPALMVICVACGSNTITLMYDGGFLLFKGSFGISMKDTFKTWGLLELMNSVVGLIVVLIISFI